MDLEALRKMLREGKRFKGIEEPKKVIPGISTKLHEWSDEDFYKHKKGEKSLAEIIDGPPDHPRCKCVSDPLPARPEEIAEIRARWMREFTKPDPTAEMSFSHLHECQGDHGIDGPQGLATCFVPSMTRYPDEKPTSGWWFCRDCARTYIEEWQERWDEYYASQF